MEYPFSNFLGKASNREDADSLRPATGRRLIAKRRSSLKKGNRRRPDHWQVFFGCFPDMSHHRLNCKVVVTVVKGKHHSYPSTAIWAKLPSVSPPLMLHLLLHILTASANHGLQRWHFPPSSWGLWREIHPFSPHTWVLPWHLCRPSGRWLGRPMKSLWRRRPWKRWKTHLCYRTIGASPWVMMLFRCWTAMARAKERKATRCLRRTELDELDECATILWVDCLPVNVFHWTVFFSEGLPTGNLMQHLPRFPWIVIWARSWVMGGLLILFA